MSLADLAASIDEAIATTLDGRPPGAKGIASVSNYGSLNIKWATPIPPADQNLLLGLGAVLNAPKWDPRAKTGAGHCEATLTFDHRVVTAAPQPPIAPYRPSAREAGRARVDFLTCFKSLNFGSDVARAENLTY